MKGGQEPTGEAAPQRQTPSDDSDSPRTARRAVTVAFVAIAILAVPVAATGGALVGAAAQPAAAAVADASPPATASAPFAPQKASAGSNALARVAEPSNARTGGQSDAGPRAEAGVDQEVTRGATVLLDATPSFSPDGDVTAYQWTVRAPNGTTFEPRCEVDSCRLANFTAIAPGEYVIELTVTDDADRTASDEIYVSTVAANEFGVELTGPETVAGVERTALTVDVDAGNATLQRLVWYDEDGVVANQSLSGLGGTRDLQTIVTPGTSYAVAVHAADGRVVGDTWTAPAASSATDLDYPYIEGPTELTGEPDYESGGDYYFEDVTYRVHASAWDVEPEVVWSHDGEKVGKGRRYTGDFRAGTQRLTATVRFAENEFDQERFDQVGGDVSANLAVFLGNRSATELIRADHNPQVKEYEIKHKNGLIDAEIEVDESNHDKIESVSLVMDGTTIYHRSPSSSGVYNDIFVDGVDKASGQTFVKLIAIDSEGQKTTKRRLVRVPTSGDVAGDAETGHNGGDRRGYYP